MSSKKPQLAKSPVIDELVKASADETAARAFIEKWRWDGEPYCPHCGDTDTYRMTGEKSEARGLHRCRGCKKQFTVKVGTIFEDSAMPLSKWCRAIHEASKAKNGVSALELARTLQITHKSALFMLNRSGGALRQVCTCQAFRTTTPSFLFPMPEKRRRLETKIPRPITRGDTLEPPNIAQSGGIRLDIR